MEQKDVLELLRRYPASGIYSGHDIDGGEVVVLRQAGFGLTVMRTNSNGWTECVEYDEQGRREGEFLEPPAGPGLCL